MIKAYVEKEIEKIINNKNFAYPLNAAMAAAWIIANLKGINLKVIQVEGKSPLADYMVLASATNPVQAVAMIDQVQKQLKPYEFRSQSQEGTESSDWLLLDLGDIIVHVFLESSRDLYDLDIVWKDAPHVDIPQEYYFGSNEEDKDSSDKFKDYY